MATGTVKAWLAERGFGFITADEGAGEVFFHVRQLVEDFEPVPGDLVEYERGVDPRDGRPCAVAVRLVE